MENKIKCLPLAILSLVSLTSCGTFDTGSNTWLETNYFNPTVDTKFEQIDEGTFRTKYGEEFATEVNYSYVSFDIAFSTAYYGYSKNLYFVGNVNKGFFAEYGHEGTVDWVRRDRIHTDGVSLADLGKIYVNNAIFGAYKLSSNCSNFTCSPYSYIYNYQGERNNINFKYVYSDSFLLESISYTFDEFDVFIKVNYFNESDLPTGKGRIDRDTFVNKAYIEAFKETNITKIKATLKGQNIVVGTKNVYDSKFDSYVLVETRGNATVNYNINIEKISGMSETIYTTWKMEDYKVTSGKISEENIFKYRTELIIGPKAYKFSYSFASYIYAKEDVNCIYTNSPLSITVNSANQSNYVEFSNEGIVTERIFSDHEINEKFTITYKHS